MRGGHCEFIDIRSTYKISETKCTLLCFQERQPKRESRIPERLLGDVNSGPGTGTYNLYHLTKVIFVGQGFLIRKMRHWMVLEVSSVSTVPIPRLTFITTNSPGKTLAGSSQRTFGGNYDIPSHSFIHQILLII